MIQGQIAQEFCHRKCKDRFHNRAKLKLNREALAADLRVILEKHGVRI